MTETRPRCGRSPLKGPRPLLPGSASVLEDCAGACRNIGYDIKYIVLVRFKQI